MNSTCRNKNIHKFESGTYINCFCILSDIEIIVKNNKMITSNYFCCKKEDKFAPSNDTKIFYVHHFLSFLHFPFKECVAYQIRYFGFFT